MTARIDWLDAAGLPVVEQTTVLGRQSECWLAARGAIKIVKHGIRNTGDRTLHRLVLFAKPSGVTTVRFKRVGRRRKYVRRIIIGDFKPRERLMFYVEHTATGMEGPPSMITVEET